MSFVWPGLLWLLSMIPLLGALYVWWLRRRQRLLARYGSFGLASLREQKPDARRHVPPALFLVALAMLVVAIARPQATVSLPRVEGTVILAFDVSGSMAASDLEPTRMEAAKTAARAFVERQPPGILIGVVAFSDSGLSVQPPSDDTASILAAINRLSPQRGTSLGSGILAALNAIAANEAPPTNYYSDNPTPATKRANRSAVVVLLTDGENTTPSDPLEAAQVAAEQGVRVFTVGVGSPEGAVLEVEGFSVRTRLDEATLRQIAQLTEGEYFNAANAEELRAIYEGINLQFVARPQKMEITSLVAGVGLLTLLIGSALSFVWFGRLV